MARLPRIADLDAAAAGWGFFLCVRKDVRTGKKGDYLALLLQDASGEIQAKVFEDVENARLEFDAGEFVKVQGRGNSFNQQLELILDKVRRVMPEKDAADGFREEDCIRSAVRPAEEMWQDLQAHIARVSDSHVQTLLTKITTLYADQYKTWPAARQVHHAYRGGLLEHVLGLDLALPLDSDLALQKPEHPAMVQAKQFFQRFGFAAGGPLAKGLCP